MEHDILAHTAGFPARILFEVVELYRMVEDGAELIVDRFEIYGRKRFPVFVLVIHKLVLPCDDLLGGDVAHLQFTEVRQQLGTDDMLLGRPLSFKR